MKTPSPFSLLLLVIGCGASVEPITLPATCHVELEYVRKQVCPESAAAVVCSNTEQTNPAFAHCGGPGWTEGRQVTGNVWCCDDALVGLQ